MRLERPRIVDAPGDPARVRLMAEVSYLDRTAEEYWFEVDREFAGALSRRGNPWLVCLLPLAATIGEPLEIEVPVDARLYEGVQDVMWIWKAWYPHLHVVPVKTDTIDEATSPSEGRAGAFFSGGVDSFFTVLRHGEHSGHPAIRLDDLISVGGLVDIPLANVHAFARVRKTLGQAAAELGKRLMAVSTNLPETRWKEANWARISHGPALCAVALALEVCTAR